MQQPEIQQTRPSLVRFAVLSIVGAILTIALKAGAYALTGSVGLLSDALESIVNLVAAILALIVLIIAAKPADEKHPYGHEKVEYFSSGAEGMLILLAALMIIVTAIDHLLNPTPLEQPGLGMGLAVLASIVNFVLARILLGAARRHDSITLEADAQHILSDVWTTGGVLVGVGIVMLTGWLWVDAVVAIGVGLHIIRTGWGLVKRSINGLMDAALADDEIAQITSVLDTYCEQGVLYHALRTRRSGAQRFMSVHILVPGSWTVQKGHDLLEQIEQRIANVVSPIQIDSHLEPLEDPASWDDGESMPAELRRCARP
ncbi:cation diffusion facilitator family transporter [Paenalcaligenes suwonensis]|uniref:cation diffusion facilitator family transporter n=1 Tax=Paenalcaligenes suwonensis TaxID=1202713 RepID=UPI001409EBC6|nr:cation diffusion facilitator family transporter [Paenalcaligenes suwonensis]NHC60921.1 cation transporter [Paenalcaligenes suwonensis]